MGSGMIPFQQSKGSVRQMAMVIMNNSAAMMTLGELKKTYAISDIAFIGGSFNQTGGHNPLEATIYGVPTISGPNIKNFRDIFSILTRANASYIAKTEQDLFNKIAELLSNPEKLEYMHNACNNIFEEQKGAIEFVISKIGEYL